MNIAVTDAQLLRKTRLRIRLDEKKRSFSSYRWLRDSGCYSNRGERRGTHCAVVGEEHLE